MKPVLSGQPPDTLPFLLLGAVCHSGERDGDLVGGVLLGLNSLVRKVDLLLSSPRYKPGTVLLEGLESLRLYLDLGECKKDFFP